MARQVGLMSDRAASPDASVRDVPFRTSHPETMSLRPRRNRGLGRAMPKGIIADASALALIVVLAGLFAVCVNYWGMPPFEDAAILMHYAEHLAQGHGIVWNIGEAPVDGGTDFLFMVCIAAARYIGFSLETATQLIAVLAHFGTVVLIYIGMRQVQRSGIVPAFLSAAYFAIGPGLFLAAAYFGTPFFAFAIAVTWLLAQRVMFARERHTRDLLYFSLACLAAGLSRPEGVLISVFMLAALGVVLPAREFGRLAMVFGTVVLVLGGAYFVWHWSYFGHPLPNPFYVKGGGHLYVSALYESVWRSAFLLFPFLPAFLLSVRSSNTFRLGVAFSIPIVASVGMWVFLSNAMNFGGRFQYPVLAIGVLSWYPLVRSLRDDLRLPTFASLFGRQQLAVILAACLCVASVFAVQFRYSAHIKHGKDSLYDVGVMLGHFADRNYTIATTEAGQLPLYSKWRAVDTWGLNDEWIAHNGGEITQEYLERRRPDLIMFMADEPRQLEAFYGDRLGKRWSRQIQVLRGYAEQRHFTLAAAFGISPKNTHCFYVRSDLPEHDQIVQAIRSMDDYASDYLGPGKAQNFTGLPESLC
jgi:arabinofuranosyltransferase